LRRVGFGYDLHRLVRGRKLLLAGVELPSPVGALAHSDGDTLIHALIDALLGACALGDIGRHFPPEDPRYESISSRLLLARTAKLLRERGFQPSNVDCTVVLQRPRLAPLVEQMRRNLASDLDLSLEAVSVKAKTAEGLGPTGRGRAVEVYAVALVQEHGVQEHGVQEHDMEALPAQERRAQPPAQDRGVGRSPRGRRARPQGS
jgi:2-C-methyl-D-erythritol 2,4-cyclodiphosphate synthase